MTPRKLIAALAALVALGAGVFLLISRQIADQGSVNVLLRPPSTAVGEQSAVHLTVPRRYIALSGIEKLLLEIERVESTPLRIEVTAHDPFPNGLGERCRDEALNQPLGARKQLTVPPADHPQEMIGYIFANIPGAMAYYFKADDDGVFVDCSERPRCRGFLTWRGLLDVQYEYTRAGLDDPRPMNASVRQLLESFAPAAVPLSQLVLDPIQASVATAATAVFDQTLLSVNLCIAGQARWWCALRILGSHLFSISSQAAQY
jgi:hypothetical protein